ncbi:MAG: hypothetical protein IKV99_04825 [Oscillospiraceae bacterium]|nr:hypothetical protein [Oscillospiraceae bacterium]
MTFKTLDFFTNQIANVSALKNVSIQIGDWRGHAMGFISKSDDTLVLMAISIEPCPLEQLLSSSSLRTGSHSIPIQSSSCSRPSDYIGRDGTFVNLSMLMQAGWSPCNEIFSSSIWIEDFYYTSLSLGISFSDIPQITEGSLLFLEN